ncbi:hypothetical protein I3F58_04110 [Streptomyces sp. MUM 203J]|nr:hypothetical protein [Streptomyces sp. MUM 203J]
MAADMVKQFRTAIFSLLRGLLALLGFRPTAAAKAAPALSAVSAALPVRTVSLPAQRTDACPVRKRALPPTMKQRIRAEAHGTSPAVRRPSGAAPADAAPDGVPAAD